MKRSCRLLALILVVAACLIWLARGANRGWSKTSVPVRIVDEVTGIEGVQYRPRFVPGLDFLAAAVLGAGLLAGASLLLHAKQPTQTNS